MTIKIKQIWIGLTIFVLFLTACSEVAAPPAATIDEPVLSEETAVAAPIEEAATTPAVATTSEAATAAEPAATGPAEDPKVNIEPIQVTYFTPAQQEGPYYPVEKLADQDNDLTVLAGAAGAPAGTPLEFSGSIYDATGMPLAGIVVEIWQTDNNGAYLHPNDPATENRDRNFQFYGEATTGPDGRYQFRTIMPGKYEPRPVHIHVKIKADNQELLTTQFYFAGDPSLENEGLTQEDNVHMMMNLSEGVAAAGNPILIGERDVVLSLALPAYYPESGG